MPGTTKRTTVTIPGDYARARKRAEAAVRAEGMTLEPASPDGILLARRARLLGTVTVALRLVEVETGEVEVTIEASGTGLAGAGAAAASIARALRA